MHAKIYIWQVLRQKKITFVTTGNGRITAKLFFLSICALAKTVCLTPSRMSPRRDIRHKANDDEGLEAEGLSAMRLRIAAARETSDPPQAPDGPYAGCCAPCKRAVLALFMTKATTSGARTSPEIARWRCALQSAESPEAGGDVLQELFCSRKAFSKIAPTVFLK